MAEPSSHRQPDRLIPVPPFVQTLGAHGLTLLRAETTVLQINVGFLCNQVCRHCHLEAGPARNEIMSRDTADAVIDFADRERFEMIDITGGAPELHPDINAIVSELSPLSPKTVFRSNLTALKQVGSSLMNHLKDCRVDIVASFPSLNETQTESIRGKGCFHISIDTLKELNRLGYGREGTGLNLDLVVNPAGAFLPPPQDQIEKRYRKILEEKWGITFNKALSFANVPLGRFRSWLIRSNNYRKYMERLVSAFNPCTIDGLMCRSMISVSWDGYLFDCDFNQAAERFMGNRKIHISQMKVLPEPGTPIATDAHCYTCTAGSGFT